MVHAGLHELDGVSGGTLNLEATTGSANTDVNHSEFSIVKLMDAATPK
jgi:hypothetical protein